MERIKSLLGVRQRAKKYSPDFLVKESKAVDRIKRRWRFPMGRHSKVRQYHCGRPAMPTPGYGSPKEVRGLHSSGYKPVVVGTVKDLGALNPATEAAIISRTVGRRKKMDLLSLAVKNNIKVINVRDPRQLMEKFSQEFAARKNLKKAKLDVKSKKQQEKEQKAAEKLNAEKLKKESVKPESAVENKDAVEISAEVLDEQKKAEQREMEKTMIKRN